VRAGYTVAMAVNGRECVDKVMANRTEYGLIIIDQNMPVMNGTGNTQNTRNDDFNPRV